MLTQRVSLGNDGNMKQNFKLFLILATLFLIAPLAEPILSPVKDTPSALFLVIIAALIMLPGKKQVPRLIRALPWFWILNFMTAVSVLALGTFKYELMPEEVKKMFNEMYFPLILGVFSSPILIVLYAKKSTLFLKALVATTVLEVLFSGIELLRNIGSFDRPQKIIEFLLGAAVSMSIAAYALKHQNHLFEKQS